MTEYITVKEFSTIAGITQQCVYQQLDKKLKDHFKIIDGKKMIDKSAVVFFKNNEKPTVEQLLVEAFNNDLTSRLTKENETLKEQIEQLKIEHKFDIENLKNLYQSQIDELKKDKENYNQLLNQQQQLNAMAQQKILLLEDKVNQKWWQKLFNGKGEH